jgi:hypothetical protein
MTELCEFVLEYSDSCFQELSLMLLQSNNPLFTFLRGFTGQKEILADLCPLKNNLESIRALGRLLVDFYNLEIVQGVELPGIIISLFLSVEIHDTSISNDAEFLGPLVSLKHSLSAFPEETDTRAFNIDVFHYLINECSVIFDELSFESVTTINIHLTRSYVLFV